MANRFNNFHSNQINGHGHGHGPSHTHSHSCNHSSSSAQRPNSFSSGYSSGYTSPNYSPTFMYSQSPPQSPTGFMSPGSGYGSGATSPEPSLGSRRLYDVNATQCENSEYERSMEFHQAPDTFPCGHILCHNCLRKFMRGINTAQGQRCPVCRFSVRGEDVSLAAMGLPSERQETAPISLLTNFDEIVAKFNGITQNLRRLKDESVHARSMGMTYTNTQCHLCHESHPTLRVIQEHNQLSVQHERPGAWSNYFYRLQHGKVVTTFYTKVNSSTICVPCTYRELQESKAILPLDLQHLPNVDPTRNQQLALTEVGKMVAKSMAPLMVLRGKNVIEVDHKVRLRERADHFCFTDTAKQIEGMVKQQEDSLLRMATKQIRDTGRLYHVTESNEIEYDMDETIV